MRRPLDEFVMPVSNTDSNGVHFVPITYYRLFNRKLLLQDVIRIYSPEKRLGQRGYPPLPTSISTGSINDNLNTVKRVNLSLNKPNCGQQVH